MKPGLELRILSFKRKRVTTLVLDQKMRTAALFIFEEEILLRFFDEKP